MIVDALEHLVCRIVDSSGDADARTRSNRRGELLKVRVNPEDLGHVIGRNSRTAKTLRLAVGVLSPEGNMWVGMVEAGQS